MKRIITVLLVLLMLAGCSTGSSEEQSSSGSSISPIELPADSEMFTDRDRRTDYDAGTATAIDLSSATSTVTISEEGTYVLSGDLSGMIVVDAPDTAKLQIVLNGVKVTSTTSAALYVREADKVFVTLAENTENTLENGGTFESIDDNNIDAAVFSKQDITFNGSGSLTVTSPVGHGIVSKDDLVITGGSYTVNCASHGLDANDSIRIVNASLNIRAGKDALHAENNDDASLGFVYLESGSYVLNAEGDGISAGSTLTVKDGSYTITAGGGSVNGSQASSDNYGGFMGGGMMGGGMMRPDGMGGQPRTTSTITSTTEDSASMKGLKSGTGMTLSGGSFTIDSADDGIHANTSAAIAGGNYTIASGDDGIHAEDTLTVSDGNIQITESYEGLEALHIRISGGNITLKAGDDGLNAAGGTDNSGMTGGRDGMFGGGMMGGGMSANSDGSIVISGGELYINASGDGIDANGYLEITGGHTVVCGPTMGDTATLDYDTSATITGGTFIGTGASGMAQTFSDSEQGVIAVQVGQQSAGTLIRVTDASGRDLIRHEPELSFAVVILSSPDLVSGTEYTVYVGELSETFSAS